MKTTTDANNKTDIYMYISQGTEVELSMLFPSCIYNVVACYVQMVDKKKLKIF